MRPSSTDVRRVRDRLEQRRRELLVRYKDLLDAEAEVSDGSPELIDVANDQWDARVLAAMSEHDALALENVVAALHRLDTGTYGVCTRCGEKVSPERLHVLPEVGHCTPCASAIEKPRHPQTGASWS